MNNHFHLLLLSPKEDIDRVMYFLMKNMTKTIQKRSGRINRIFGGRYKGCVIEKERYLLNVYKYIYRNPIAAGIVSRAEDYPYSSFSYELSKVPLKVEIESLFGKTLDLLDWVNQSYKQEEAESIAYGLKRTNFQFKRDRSTNKIIIPV